MRFFFALVSLGMAGDLNAHKVAFGNKQVTASPAFYQFKGFTPFAHPGQYFP